MIRAVAGLSAVTARSSVFESEKLFFCLGHPISSYHDERRFCCDNAFCRSIYYNTKNLYFSTLYSGTNGRIMGTLLTYS